MNHRGTENTPEKREEEEVISILSVG